MIRLAVNVLVLILLCFSRLSAQETPRNERNDGGTLVNQDYFTADLYPETKYLLFSVEKNHLNNRVWADFYAGRYYGVLPDLNYILDKFPNHPRALMLLGTIAKITGEVSMPLPYYIKALKLYPQYALIHAQSGNYLVDIGRVDLGISKLEEAVKLDPTLARAHAWLAKAYYKSGKPDLARQAADRARSLGYKGKIRHDGHARKSE